MSLSFLDRMAAKHRSLPPLQVAIMRDGKVTRVTSLPDPRTAFCECFNSFEMGGQSGLTAIPITDSDDALESAGELLGGLASAIDRHLGGKDGAR